MQIFLEIGQLGRRVFRLIMIASSIRKSAPSVDYSIEEKFTIQVLNFILGYA